MTIIIFTKDPTPFMTGDYLVMHRTLDTAPTQANVTYILHSDKFGVKEIEFWSPVIQNRLVIVTTKAPKITKKIEDKVVVDDKLLIKTKDNYFGSVKSLLTWSDRNRVSKVMHDTPLPLVIAFLKENDIDIEVWRSITKTHQFLPEKYTRALLTYMIEPKKTRIKWPKKKSKVKEIPSLFKNDDEHWEIIVEKSISVANTLRERGDALPKGIKKRKQVSDEWV
tara:strand:- start:116 stop:784 length:669 start_codon:yes stop_codon:yes gene_type:complete